MADKVYVTKSKLTAVADAIRTKGGTSASLTLDQMPAAVQAIPSGGGEDYLACRIGRQTPYRYDNSQVDMVKKHSFYDDWYLSHISLPAVINIFEAAFYNTIALSEAVEFPELTYIENEAFCGSAITSFMAPKISTIMSDAFKYCEAITVDLGSTDRTNAITIYGNAFNNAKIQTLIIRNNAVATMYGTSNMPYLTGIYVPDSLVDSYKTATNWSTYADKIKPLSEYTA